MQPIKHKWLWSSDHNRNVDLLLKFWGISN